MLLGLTISVKVFKTVVDVLSKPKFAVVISPIVVSPLDELEVATFNIFPSINNVLNH